MKKSWEVCVPTETWKDGLPNSCSWCKTTTCGQHYKHEESPSYHFRYTTVKQHFFTQPLHTHRISLSLCHHYQSPCTILLTCNRTKFFPQLPKGMVITVTFSSTMHFHLRGTQFFNKSSPQTSRVYKYRHWNQQLKSRNSSSAELLFIHVFCPNK